MRSTLPTVYCFSIGSSLGSIPSSGSMAGLPTVPAVLSAGSMPRMPTMTLPMSGAVTVPPGAVPTDPGAGVSMGESIAPIPSRVADKVLKRTFVDMAELLPEVWAVSKADETTKASTQRRPRQVTDIFTWMRCFAAYVAVLSSNFNEEVPELMAYMVTILRVSQDFAGLAWVRYDAAYRRQAASTGNRKWSQINSSLYAICRAQVVSRCDLCCSSAHATTECTLAMDQEPDMPHRVVPVTSTGARAFRTSSKRVYGNLPPLQCRSLSVPGLPVPTRLLPL